MSEHHHHHRHHKKDSSSIFKEKSLKRIKTRKKVEEFIKRALFVFAILMGLAVIIAYTIG